MSKPRCSNCPLRMLAEGTLPSGYTVKKRKLIKVRPAKGKPHPVLPIKAKADKVKNGKSKNGKVKGSKLKDSKLKDRAAA